MLKYKLRYLSISQYIILFTFCFLLFALFVSPILAQAPESDNYKLQDFGFGAGGTTGSNSDNYSVYGVAGQVEQGQAESDNYKVNEGLTYVLQANVPPAPNVTNPDNYYNKLKIIIATGNNPDDTEFAIAASTDNFVSDTRYVQSTETLGATLGSEDWQTYASWGGASGFLVIGLSPGTTYQFKVMARQGIYTQSGFGPEGSAATISPTLTFDLDVSSIDEETAPPFTVSLGNLTPSSVTTASNKVWVDVSTNGSSGALVYVVGSNNGLLSISTSKTINSATSNLALGGVTEGYGAKYNSVDETSGGPIQPVTPYDGSGENVGVLDTTKRLIFDSSDNPVSGGRASFLIKAKISALTEAAPDYTDTVTVIATAAY